MLIRNSLLKPAHHLQASVATLSVIVALAATAPSTAALVPGVDVYSGNGNITWSSVKNAGYQFAFVKATEGVNFIDTKFAANMTNANTAGLWVAPYHFAHPESKNGVAWGSTYNGQSLSPNSATQLNRDGYADAVSEATDFLSSIRPYYLQKGNTKYMKPVLDLELSTIPDFNSTSLEKTFVSNWVQVFSDTILSSLGVRPFMYLSKSSANTYWTSAVAAQHDFWIAQYKGTGTTSPPMTSDTPLFKPWSFWQWSDGEDAIAVGTPIPGISAAVDRDVFSGTVAQLANFRLQLPEPTAMAVLAGVMISLTRRARRATKPR